MIIGATLILAVATAYYLVSRGWVDQLSIEVVRDWIAGHGTWGVGVYILLLSLNYVTLLPPVVLLLVSAGVLFGPYLGALALWTGIQIGSSLAFFVGRYFGQDLVSKELEGKAKDFYERLEREGHKYLFVVKLTGVPPTELVNYACGVTKMSFRRFLIVTMIAPVPGIFVLSFAGEGVTRVDWTDPRTYLIPVLGLVVLLCVRLVRRKPPRPTDHESHVGENSKEASHDRD